MKCIHRIMFISLLLVVLPLVGCRTTDNPTEGGFLGGLHGITSGAYEQRLQADRARLAGAQLQGQHLSYNNSQLENQASETVAQRTQLRQRLAILDSRTRELTAQTSRMQANTEAARAQRADLDKRLVQVRTEIAVMRRNVDVNRITADEAENERRALEHEVTLLKAAADALQ